MAALKRFLQRLPRVPNEFQPELDLAITITRKSSKIWSTFPCELWLETNAKVKVYCTNVSCKFEEEREWHGMIFGNGIHGSLNALLVWIKCRNEASKARTPLMGIFVDCCGEPDDPDYIDQVLNKTSGSLIFSLSAKKLEEMVSSKVIIMEGALMSAIKTVGIDSQCKEWDMLTPIFKYKRRSR
jgi:hypothetical protein